MYPVPGIGPDLAEQSEDVLLVLEEISAHVFPFNESSTQALSLDPPSRSHSMLNSILDVELVPERSMFRSRTPYAFALYVHEVEVVVKQP